MSGLEPNIDVITALSTPDAEVEGRFALVLLYRYEDGDGAYTTWLNAVLPTLADVGARVVWSATNASPVVGDPARTWDVVSIIEYPDRAAFLRQVQAGDFQGVEAARLRAMISNEIYGCVPVIDALDQR